MPAKTNRTETLRLRVTQAQKALVQENANRAGYRDASKYLRCLALSEEGVDLARAIGGGRGEVAAVCVQPADATPGPDLADFEALVRETAKRMPQRNAEGVVRREMAREKARAALSSV